jgi:hypothetical protein
MRARPQTIIIASMALVIAVLAWALVYFGRDEMHLSAKAPEDEIPVRSALSMQGGSAAVRLTEKSQQASGIVVQTLEKAQADAAAEVYGVVVNVQPLLDLRARYAASVSEAQSLRAAASNSAADYQRLKKLFEDDRNVSERALQAAEAQWKADQARLSAAEQAAAAVRDTIRAGWGEVLAGWATNPESSAFQALARQHEVLAQITFPYDLHAQAGRVSLLLAPVSVPDQERPARFLSAAPQTDVTLPGVPPVATGHLHLVNRTRREIEDAFVGLGYRVMEGPEVEHDYYNFTALNHPPGHPARLVQDSFYVDPSSLRDSVVNGPYAERHQNQKYSHANHLLSTRRTTQT